MSEGAKLPEASASRAHVGPAKGVAREGTPKCRAEHWAIAIALVSLVLSFVTAYHQFWYVKHGLHLNAFRFDFDTRRHQMSVELMYINDGNRHETVLSSSFCLPLERRSGIAEFWPNQYPHVTLAPVVLAPGEIVHRKIVQPMTAIPLMQYSRVDSSIDRHLQQVALEVVVASKLRSRMPSRHVIPVARTRELSDSLATWDVVDAYGVDLLAGSYSEVRLDLTNRRYESGQVEPIRERGRELARPDSTPRGQSGS